MLSLRTVSEDLILRCDPIFYDFTVGAELIHSWIQYGGRLFKRILLAVDVGVVLVRFFSTTIRADLRRLAHPRNFLPRFRPYLWPFAIIVRPGVVQSLLPKSQQRLLLLRSERVAA